MMGDLAKKYNLKSPAVKRLMREAAELSEPTDQYFAQPLDDNLFEWHFTVRGPSDTEFDDGRYHGRITLPAEYPMKPPSIILLTPNGRFELGKKICLSMSAHHPETWQPSWSIRTVLLALIGFMPTPGGGAIGALDHTPEERKVMARKSKDWKCEACGSDNQNSLLERDPAKEKQEAEEAKELAAQINFKGEDKNKQESKTSLSSLENQPPPSASIPQQQQQQMYGNYAQYYGMYNNPVQNMFPNQFPPMSNPSPQQATTTTTSSNATTTTPMETSNDATGDINNENESNLRQRVRPATEVDNNDALTSENLSELLSENRTAHGTSRAEHVSLVLTWIVTACLVILILRRLAMEGTTMGK